MSYNQIFTASSSRRIRVIPKFVIVFVSLLTGCLVWTPVGRPTAAGAQLPLPEKVLVITGKPDTTILRHPRIEGDALVGEETIPPNRLKTIPLLEIREMNKRTVSRGRTLTAVVAAALVGGLIYESSRPPCKDCITF